MLILVLEGKCSFWTCKDHEKLACVRHKECKSLIELLLSARLVIRQMYILRLRANVHFSFEGKY